MVCMATHKLHAHTNGGPSSIVFKVWFLHRDISAFSSFQQRNTQLELLGRNNAAAMPDRHTNTHTHNLSCRLWDIIQCHHPATLQSLISLKPYLVLRGVYSVIVITDNISFFYLSVVMYVHPRP